MLVLKRASRLLRCFSFTRFRNLIQLGTSYLLSSIIGKPIHWGNPFATAFEPTTACNLRCPQCPSGLRSFTRNTGHGKLEEFKTFLDQASKETFYINLYFQGEPFLNPDFLDMVRYANSKRMYTYTSTNAHYLTPEVSEQVIQSGLDELIISIDGSTQESYEKYRVGGSIEKVLEGIKNLHEARKKLGIRGPILVLQFVVFSHNENEMQDIKKIAQTYSIDEVRFKTAQIYDYEGGSELIPEEAKSRYKKTTEGYELKGTLPNRCWKMWSANVVTWDGDVVPCCFDKDAEHVLGTTKDFNMKSDKYSEFRNQLWKDRKSIDICKNCTVGTKTWL